MAHTVGIRSLQQHASKVLARVAAGEEVEVTDRGRPVARIVPIRASRRDDLVAAGRLRPARRPLELPDAVRPRAGEPTAAEILAEMRDDER